MSKQSDYSPEEWLTVSTADGRAGLTFECQRSIGMARKLSPWYAHHGVRIR
jgi:hypothetical protein